MPALQQTVRSRLKTRRFDQSVMRAFSIAGRYGSDSFRFRTSLAGFVDLTSAFHVIPTFPVTAMVLLRHPQVLCAVARKGAELAAHGYAHLDYTGMPSPRIEKHIREAKTVFQKHGFERVGFRFPFLRRNPGLLAELDRQTLAWDSSEVLNWDVLERKDFSSAAWDAYARIMDTYAPKPASASRSLPYFIGNLVEIPVSMPDDDILIDRMRIREPGRLLSVWEDMLTDTWTRGEVMVLQLHPERFFLFQGALRSLLLKANGLGNVWTASLGEIAEWWREKNSLRFEFRNLSSRETEIICGGSTRAEIVLNDGKPGAHSSLRSMASGPDGAKRWRVTGRIKPWIGISPEFQDSGESVREMTRQGFLVQKSASDRGFTRYISTEPGSASAALRFLRQFPERLLRVAVWPRGNRSALSVTGDIDGLDVWDFWSRFHAG